MTTMRTVTVQVTVTAPATAGESEITRSIDNALQDDEYPFPGNWEVGHAEVISVRPAHTPVTWTDDQTGMSYATEHATGPQWQEHGTRWNILREGDAAIREDHGWTP